MNEHGWPDDHYDHDGADLPPHADAVSAEETPELDAGLPDDVWDTHDDPHQDPLPEADHDPGYQHHSEEPAAGVHSDAVAHADPQEMATVGADPDALPDTGDQPVFPPVVDVGPLPEPVDGYPWIDTGSLGRTDPAGELAAAEPGPGGHAAAEPDPSELAGYAAQDLPPGVDPWAALAGSEDPATSALARFWSAPPAGEEAVS